MISEVMNLPYAHFISLYLPQPTLTRNQTPWGSYLCRCLTNTENNMDTKNEIQMIHIIQMFSKTPRVPCAHIRGTRDIYKKQVYICISVLPPKEHLYEISMAAWMAMRKIASLTTRQRDRWDRWDRGFLKRFAYRAYAVRVKSLKSTVPSVPSVPSVPML